VSGGISSTAKKPFLALLSIVAITGSIVFILKTSNREPSYNPTLASCLAERMLLETQKLVEGEIVVLSVGEGEFKDETTQAQLSGLKEALRKFKRLQLAGVEGPVQPEMYGRLTIEQGVPEEFLAGVLQKYPQAKVIVSFLGVPVLAGKKIDPSKLPKVVALDNAYSDEGRLKWKGLVESNIVNTVICARSTSIPTSPEAKNPCDQIFNAHYQIVTSANVNELFQHQPPGGTQSE
jgi:hypothetical protein